MKPFLYSVLPRPPHPSRDGLAIRNYHLLEALTEHFEVRAFSLLDPERAYGRGRVPPGVEIEWVPPAPARRARRWRRSQRASLGASPIPSCSTVRGRSPAASPRRRRRAPRSWIVAHSYHVAPARDRRRLPGLDRLPQRRFGDLGAHGNARVLGAGGGSSRGSRRRGSQPSRWSSWPARRASRACRGATRPRSGARGGPGPLVVPNGVDLSRYAFRTGRAAEEMIFFVGDLSWPPNAEGVRWFAQRVWPLVRKRRPIAWVEILGRGAPADLQRPGRPNFVFAGEGDDTRPTGRGPRWRSCRSWPRAARA